MSLEASIKDTARELGFDLVGITTAEPFPEADAAYQRWIDSGAHAGMAYMAAQSSTAAGSRVRFARTLQDMITGRGDRRAGAG